MSADSEQANSHSYGEQPHVVFGFVGGGGLKLILESAQKVMFQTTQKGNPPPDDSCWPPVRLGFHWNQLGVRGTCRQAILQSEPLEKYQCPMNNPPRQCKAPVQGLDHLGPWLSWSGSSCKGCSSSLWEQREGRRCIGKPLVLTDLPTNQPRTSNSMSRHIMGNGSSIQQR